MAESNFVDYVKIYCRSGKGGRGSVHMHRAKYTPNAKRLDRIAVALDLGDDIVLVVAHKRKGC